MCLLRASPAVQNPFYGLYKLLFLEVPVEPARSPVPGFLASLLKNVPILIPEAQTTRKPTYIAGLIREARIADGFHDQLLTPGRSGNYRVAGKKVGEDFVGDAQIVIFGVFTFQRQANIIHGREPYHLALGLRVVGANLLVQHSHTRREAEERLFVPARPPSAHVQFDVAPLELAHCLYDIFQPATEPNSLRKPV